MYRLWFAIVVGIVLVATPTALSAQTPTRTPIIRPTATVTLQTATVIKASNLRAGPGTTFAISGKAKAGDKIKIAGSNPAGDLYQLDNDMWIAAFLVKIDTQAVTAATTKTAPLPTKTAPTAQPPTATPPAIGSFPYTIAGTGDSVVDVSAYADDVALLEISGNASSRFFAIQAYDANNNYVELIVNTTEPYSGVRPLNFTKPTVLLEI